MYRPRFYKREVNGKGKSVAAELYVSLRNGKYFTPLCGGQIVKKIDKKSLTSIDRNQYLRLAPGYTPLDYLKWTR